MAFEAVVTQPCPVFVGVGFPDALDALLRSPDPSPDVRKRAWEAIEAAAGLRGTHAPPYTRAGARIPILVHSPGLSLAEVVVVELGKVVVVVASSSEAAGEMGRLVRRVAKATDGDRRILATRIARYAAESLARNVLEGRVREELLQLENDAVKTLTADPETSTDGSEAQAGRRSDGEAERIERAVSEAAHVPLRLQEFRAALRAVEPRMRAAERARCDSWCFGEITHREVVAGATRDAASHLFAATSHLGAAATEAGRLRRDAIDVVSTTAAAAQGLQTRLANTTRKATEGFQIAATTLTAALAGPGLLFALWALDVWTGPWYAIVLAGALALGLLLLVSMFLRRLGPERSLSRREALAGVVFVVLLVAAGLVAPTISNPSDADRTRQTVREIQAAIEGGNFEQRDQMVLLRREVRRLRVAIRARDSP